VAKAADCKSAIVGSTPTGASEQKTPATPGLHRVSQGFFRWRASHRPAPGQPANSPQSGSLCHLQPAGSSHFDCPGEFLGPPSGSPTLGPASVFTTTAISSAMTSELINRITVEPGKRSGKPCVRGLRITVSDVLEYLTSGMTEAEILADFPELTSEDIRACLAFAAERERRLLGSVA
jgi:uncharacterized protein (DUF433 family)